MSQISKINETKVAHDDELNKITKKINEYKLSNNEVSAKIEVTDTEIMELKSGNDQKVSDTLEKMGEKHRQVIEQNQKNKSELLNQLATVKERLKDLELSKKTLEAREQSEINEGGEKLRLDLKGAVEKLSTVEKEMKMKLNIEVEQTDSLRKKLE